MTSYITDVVLIAGIIFVLYFLIRTVIVRPDRLRFSLFWLISGVFFILCAIMRKAFPDTLLDILCAMILLFCIILVLSMAAIPIIVSHEKTKALDLRCKYAILLGVHYPSEEFRIRSEAALRYWQTHPDCCIICSGGQGSDEECSEASAYHKYLEEHGVPHEKLLVEERSAGTMENVCNSLALMHTPYISSGTVIITSDYHIPRAIIIAGKCGIKDAAAYPAYCRTISWPNYVLRELLALILLYAPSNRNSDNM